MSKKNLTTDFAGAPLGKESEYKTEYDPALLYPIPRALNREKLLLPDSSILPFSGEDIWNAYELSWLNAKGKPEVALATFNVSCESLNIVESKSFKLYLNSFNQTSVESAKVLRSTLQEDLTASFGGEVGVELLPLSTAFNDVALPDPDFVCLDTLDVSISCYQRSPELLTCTDQRVKKKWSSHLLKSNCPVTGQPDWASVYIAYEGREIVPESLLAYIVSYREQQDFHEHCVETIFTDLMTACAPERLTVYARYTRRGGLDINPFRSNFEPVYGNWRVIRQ